MELVCRLLEVSRRDVYKRQSLAYSGLPSYHSAKSSLREFSISMQIYMDTVSYTHLDVYKRQLTSSSGKVFQVLFGVLGLHMRTDVLQIDGIEKFLQSFGRVTAMQTIEDLYTVIALSLIHI